MKKSKQKIVRDINMKNPYLIILAIGLVVLSSCQPGSGGNMPPLPKTYPVIAVPQKTVTGYVSYPVSIEGTVSSAVRAKVGGYITEVLVDEGEKVSRGQVLFRLETQALSQDAQAAQASVNAARVEVNRLEPLVEKGIISSIQLETARANLAQAKARYSSIAASINYANIQSPVDGYVGSISFRQGALVSPNDPTPLTTVVDIDEVYAFFSMNESDYLDFLQKAEGETLNQKIANFPPVQLQLVNGTLYDQEGRISTISGQVSSTTGTVRFRATFPNPNRLLTDGNSGTIRVPLTYENAIVVPEVSTYEQQGRVYVVRSQGDTLAISSPIGVHDRVEGLIVVSSGLEAGDHIVAEGVGLIRNNTPIKARTVAFDSLVNSLNVVFK